MRSGRARLRAPFRRQTLGHGLAGGDADGGWHVDQGYRWRSRGWDLDVLAELGPNRAGLWDCMCREMPGVDLRRLFGCPP